MLPTILDIATLKDGYRRGAFSPIDVVEAVIARIGAWEPKLDALWKDGKSFLLTQDERMRSERGRAPDFGDPAAIGIRDVNKPDFGDAVTIMPGEVPVFWACGVTPQMAIGVAKPDLAITHKPGYMLVTDMLAENTHVVPHTASISVGEPQF